MSATTQIEELDAEIKVLTLVQETLYNYYDELDCSGSISIECATHVATLIRKKSQRRAQLIADL